MVRRLNLRITCILALLAFIAYVLYFKLEISLKHGVRFVETQYHTNGNTSAFGKDTSHNYSYHQYLPNSSVIDGKEFNISSKHGVQFVETQYHTNGNTSAFGKDTSHIYSYHQNLPNSSVIVGKEFKISHTAEKILNTQTFRQKPVMMNSYASVPRIVPVTAISSNHFAEFVNNLKTAIPRFFPDVKLVLFDLGLENREVEILRNMTFVEYRKFDFARYPPHVKNLQTYAWKVLVIQEMLAECEAVMWMDSSIHVFGNFTQAFKQMVNEKSGFLFYVSHTGHSIFAATHPNMFEYFPGLPDFQKVNATMQSGGALIIFNTPEVQRDVMKWAVLCSLERNCITPIGCRLYCGATLRKRDVHSCHRFDQSLWSLLVSIAYKSQKEKYILRSSNYFATVERG